MTNIEYIKLNKDDKYLSFGNLFRVIKEESVASSTFMQSMLFGIIFNTDEIADSTVNNYCTGFRGINTKYKSYFSKILNKYSKDKEIFVSIVGKIVNLLNDKNENITNISQINDSIRLRKVCNRLYNITKNDSDVSQKIEDDLYKLLENNQLYEFFIIVLNYTILEKKQPITIHDSLTNVIEKNIYDTNIATNDVEEFVNLQLNSGIWSIRQIIDLANKNNPFACFELASMEYYGIITGKPRYDKAYKYYLIAANHKHPVANWAVGYLYYNGNIGNKSKKDMFMAFKYFNKARKLKCSNAFNSLGIMFLEGNIPHIQKNEDKAIKLFNEALSLGNIYAYNNLGKIYEAQNDYKKAYDYYIVAADIGESWAANKIGEFYQRGKGVKKDLKKAYEYYLKASESPVFTLCEWSKYNLAKYFYQNGSVEIGVKKDINKAIDLLEEINLIEAKEELIYIYYSLYIETKKENKTYLDKIYYYKSNIENDIRCTDEIKARINDRLIKLKSNSLKINIPL